MFQKAIKQEAKLRLAIAGPAGSGKTYTGLAIAQSLANGGKIAVVDTEHGSASKYADLFSFDVMEMDPPFHPDRFATAIRDAQKEGYKVVILDSLSHAWNGTGGLLEVVDQIAARSNSRNTFAAWKEGTPIYNKLVDAILQSDVHVIATMRQKMDYVLEQDERGKQKPVKVGLAPVQREGFEYEFDVVMNMNNDNLGVIVKTRCPELQGGVFQKPGKDVADILAHWLTGAPRVEMTDPFSDKAIKYASKEWNISPNETREAVEHAIKTGVLVEPVTKAAFKEFVANPQGEKQPA
jgi:nucleoside-triphosphatase THEP1